MDFSKEAQRAQTKMCEKALKTMDSVNDLLSKVDKYLTDAKKSD